jgi:hypothetical protein
MCSCIPWKHKNKKFALRSISTVTGRVHQEETCIWVQKRGSSR